MRILQVNASARSQGAQSTELANAIVAKLRAKHPTAEVNVRDLARDPVPMLDEDALQALFTAAEKRTPNQTARVAVDDRVIAQVQAADILVLGVPMYNFTISVQLKAWIDALARAGVTFRYTAQGPEGLLKGKKVYVALARGGLHRGTEADSQVPYLKTVLGFLGMREVEFVYAEGLALGPEAAQKGLETAKAEIAAVV